MTHAEVVAFLNRLEERHDVQRMKLGDLQVWPLIRVLVGSHLLDPIVAHGEGPLRKPGTLSQRAALLARGLLRSAGLTQQVGTADLLFNVYNGQQCRVGDHVEDRFAQPLLEAANSIGLTSTVIEHLHGGKSAFAAMRSAHRYDASPLLEGMAMLHWRKPTPALSGIAGLHRLVDDIRRISPQFDPGRLSDRLHNFSFYLRFHARVLKAVKPRAVFMVSWYNVEHMALAYACNGLGIVSVDLQHGVQGAAHAAYGPWLNMPHGGWSMMPTTFWCWDDVSAVGIKRWTEGTPIRTLVLGNPWLERSADLPSALHWTPDRRKRILYTAQPLVDLLPDALIEAIKTTTTTAQWIVRTHPTRPQMAAEIRERLHAAGMTRLVTVDEAVETPLAALLIDCDLHITQYSSVVIEAASMGVPTAVLHHSALDLYPEQVANGMAVLAPSAPDLVSEVETARKRMRTENKQPPLTERLRIVVG